MVTTAITLAAIIIIICMIFDKISNKIGVPVLLAFLILGMGTSLVKDLITDENYYIVDGFSTVALNIIIFYGGFGTRWKGSANKVFTESALLASVGVITTAGLTGLFCHYLLHWKWTESLLMGSVLASTDAASVFSTLRSRKLGLKNHTASVLEVESGSNDPCSYMLTTIMISVIAGSGNEGISVGSILWLIFSQIVFGVGGGFLLAFLARIALDKIKRFSAGFDSLFFLATALLAYGIPTLVGGNGYLSTYIVGMILGNTEFSGRKTQVHFFDGITNLMQVFLFFLLGLSAEVDTVFGSFSTFAGVLLPAIMVWLFMLVVARPISVFSILCWFKRKGYNLKQNTLISFVGLRGASSIVFAIMAEASIHMENNILGIVFFIVLISIGFQGSLIPWAAKMLDMIDEDEDVMKSFSDYSDDYDVQFGEFELTEKSPWVGKTIKEIGSPKSMLFAVVIRGDEIMTPRGHTQFLAGDKIVVCTKTMEENTLGELEEQRIRKNSPYIGKELSEIAENEHIKIVLLRRDNDTIIPKDNILAKAGDIIVSYNMDFVKKEATHGIKKYLKS